MEDRLSPMPVMPSHHAVVDPFARSEETYVPKLALLETVIDLCMVCVRPQKRWLVATPANRRGSTSHDRYD